MPTVYKFARLLGRRGASLLWFGALDVIIAFSLFYPSMSPEAQRIYHYVYVTGGTSLWGFLWLLVALLCFSQAFMKKDRLAFTAAIGIKIAWSTLFFAAWLIDGASRAWYLAVIFLSLAGFVFIIAGWPEGPLRIRTPGDERDE